MRIIHIWLESCLFKLLGLSNMLCDSRYSVMVPKRQGIKTKVTRKFIIANQNFFLLLHSDENIQLNSCSLGFPFFPCLQFSCEYLLIEYRYTWIDHCFTQANGISLLRLHWFHWIQIIKTSPKLQIYRLKIILIMPLCTLESRCLSTVVFFEP